MKLLFTMGRQNAIICRISYFSFISPACAHLLIILNVIIYPFLSHPSKPAHKVWDWHRILQCVKYEMYDYKSNGNLCFCLLSCRIWRIQHINTLFALMSSMCTNCVSPLDLGSGYFLSPITVIKTRKFLTRYF